MWIVIGIVIYLLIGAIVNAAIDDDYDDDAIILIVFWPFVVCMLIALLTTEALKAFGHFAVNLFRHFIYGGKQNETQEDE